MSTLSQPISISFVSSFHKVSNFFTSKKERKKKRKKERKNGFYLKECVKFAPFVFDFVCLSHPDVPCSVDVADENLPNKQKTHSHTTTKPKTN